MLLLLLMMMMMMMMMMMHSSPDVAPGHGNSRNSRSGSVRLRAQLEQAQRLEGLGQLAGGVAHDFNNLLGVILNYAAFVSEEIDAATAEDADPQWRAVSEDVGQIRRAAERAAALTRQLLSFARREVIQPQVVDLNHLLNDMIAILRRTLGPPSPSQNSGHPRKEIWTFARSERT